MENYLSQKFGIDLTANSPITIPGFKRRSALPRLFRTMGFTKGAEVGVAGGRNSSNICAGVPNLHLLCVDMWQKYEYNRDGSICRHQMNHNKNYENAKIRLQNYNVTFVVGSSMDAVKNVPLESIDFVYIDANHYYSYVKDDLTEWSKRVRSGGIIAGHDYFQSPNCDVIEVVNEYTKEYGIAKWFLTDELQATYFWAKP